MFRIVFPLGALHNCSTGWDRREGALRGSGSEREKTLWKESAKMLASNRNERIRALEQK